MKCTFNNIFITVVLISFSSLLNACGVDLSGGIFSKTATPEPIYIPESSETQTMVVDHTCEGLDLTAEELANCGTYIYTKTCSILDEYGSLSCACGSLDESTKKYPFDRSETYEFQKNNEVVLTFIDEIGKTHAENYSKIDRNTYVAPDYSDDTMITVKTLVFLDSGNQLKVRNSKKDLTGGCTFNFVDYLK